MKMFDVCIIGGGILGCATAREIAKRNPRLSIVILEKERHLGECQVILYRDDSVKNLSFQQPFIRVDTIVVSFMLVFIILRVHSKQSCVSKDLLSFISTWIVKGFCTKNAGNLLWRRNQRRFHFFRTY